MKKRSWYLCVFVLLGILCAAHIAHRTQETTPFKVIAHRGASADAPENTLSALENAITSGTDIAEFDLRLTRDGVVVALHDASLLRTTGLDCPVCTVDNRLVHALDAGSWFSCDYCGEHIPTLDELLESARGRLRLMLELKPTNDDQMLLAKVVTLLQNKGMESECILASTDLDLLRQGKQLSPTLETVYIGTQMEPALLCHSCLDGCSIRYSDLTEQDISLAHQAGLEVYAWTIDEPEEIRNALLMGVDGVVTDSPGLALAFKNKGRNLPSEDTSFFKQQPPLTPTPSR